METFLFQSEMGHLKADNDRLQRLATSSRTLNISQSSLAHTRASNDSLDRSLSLTDQSSLGNVNLKHPFLWDSGDQDGPSAPCVS